MEKQDIQTRSLVKTRVKHLVSDYKMVFVLIGIIVVLSLVSDVFMTSKNIINILRQISINGVLALGITFVIITGGIDLSVGSVVALSSVLATSVVRADANNVLLAIVVGVGVGCLAGAISGLAISMFSIPPFIMTLAMQTITRGLALIYTNGRPVTGLGKKYAVIGQGFVGILPIPVIIFLIVAVVATFMLKCTRFGRHVYAIGGNIEAARVSGINTKAISTLVYIICGFAAGVAGLIMSSRINAGQPASGSGYELNAIAATVIGGTSLSGGVGSIIGTVVGVLIIGVINNGMNLLNITTYWQEVVMGLLIAVTVIMDIHIGKKRTSR